MNTSAFTPDQIAAAVGEGESLDHGIGRFEAEERDAAAGLISVYHRDARTQLASHRDRFAVEVDVLNVGPGPDDDRVALRGRLDGILNGRLIVGNVDFGREADGREKGNREQDRSAAHHTPPCFRSSDGRVGP